MGDSSGEGCQFLVSRGSVSGARLRAFTRSMRDRPRIRRGHSSSSNNDERNPCQGVVGGDSAPASSAWRRSASGAASSEGRKHLPMQAAVAGHYSSALEIERAAVHVGDAAAGLLDQE